MGQDEFTEVTNQSWFSRLGGAVKGILVGLVLFLIAFPLLFWNEGRSVKRHKTLQEGSGIVISVPSEKVDSANEGDLVHLSGLATTKETLSDPVFGISANAIKLKRKAEMYQWEEKTSSTEETKLGGGTETKTTYSYNKVWSSWLINSSNFKRTSGHENPKTMPYESKELVAEHVTLGAFRLPQSIVSKISGFAPLTIAESAPLPNIQSAKVQRMEKGYYLGNDINHPEIGDMRISFQVLKPMDTSVVAQQIKDSLEPYQSSQGGSIELVASGIVSSGAMFEKAEQDNVIMTWLIRLGGFILMFAGLKMALNLLSVLADVVPLFGNIVAAGTGIITFLITGLLSLITIAIAWLVYRPLIGITLLAAAIGFGILGFTKLRAAK